MKQLFTILATLVAIFSFSQTTFRIGFAYEYRDYTELNSIVQLNDGTYIGVGYSLADATHIYMVKLSAQGQVLVIKEVWGTEYNADNGNASVIKTTDGNIAVSGTLSSQIVLLKLDLDLNIIWSKTYLTTAFQGSGQGLIQTSDGGYMMTGHILDLDNVGCIIKATSDGSVSWVKRYFTSAIGRGSFVKDIVRTKDGNYIFLGYSAYSSGSDLSDTTYLVKINSTGNIIWSEYLKDTLNSQIPMSMIAASEGGVVVCGYVNNSRLMLIKFANNGNCLWSKTDSDTGYNYSFLRGIIEDKDGGYVTSGLVKDVVNSSYFDKPYLLKVNKNGILQLTKTYPYTNARDLIYFNDIIRTNDGGYATVGRSVNDGIVYKFSSDFNTCGDVESFGTLTNLIINPVSTNLSVYDEPTTSVIENFPTSSSGDVINLCTVLPLQLLSFNATLLNKNVNIQWKTANEVNTDYFTVERSNNSIAFKALQQVKTAGNSSGTHTYQITDAQPLPGTSYYRLKQVDKDGSITYSTIVSVTVTANGTMVISPNPVKDNVHVNLQSNTNSRTTIQITDITGKIIISQQTTVTTGNNNIAIPAASLSKGIYLLKVIQNNKIQSVKLIKE